MRGQVRSNHVAYSQVKRDLESSRKSNAGAVQSTPSSQISHYYKPPLSQAVTQVSANIPEVTESGHYGRLSIPTKLFYSVIPDEQNNENLKTTHSWEARKT